MTQSKEKFISRGCPCAHADDYNAVQVEQTVLCPETHSRKCVKPLGESLRVGLEDSILSETPINIVEPPLPNRENTKKMNVESRTDEIAKMRTQVWGEIGKTKVSE